ncbi:40S ribosomal protein S13 [Willisornis vidua]|uniref:Small ribosomal subunit protein uS15 n=1 Tax=Willisornis vidua TaxID=1566151 RepID=A0ABQ9D4F3_9PASS|nr:40S ribosomal protein S13 [Willisornis vidua]
MGRMHAPGKGLSQSALPYRRSVPTWLKLTSDDVKEQIYKLAKKGLTPSQIGVILRDSHGVAQVRFVTGNKILRILKSKGLAPDLPEDLYHLIKKAVAVRKHLERNRKDKDAKFRLILIESRIHRLARYYKTKRVLPPNWKYSTWNGKSRKDKFYFWLEIYNFVKNGVAGWCEFFPVTTGFNKDVS